MDPELGGDGPYPPVLDEVVAQDLRLELVVDRHRARRSVPGATPSASSYRRATPLPTDELADRARTEVAVHLGSAARCASSLGGWFGRHRRIGLAHRNSMTGEFSIARGASGTVMRHFVRTRVFAAPAPVAPLALGMTVPAASRVLIPASRPAQRFTPSEAAAARPAVVLAPVTARADEHLAPASGTEKQSGIVHCSSRRGGLDDPRSPGNTALGAVRKCGSGRSLGRDRQVSAVRGCVSLLADSDLTPTHQRCHRRYAQARVSSGRQHRLRGETTTRPRRTRWDDSALVRFDRHSQFTRAVRQITAHFHSHQHTSSRNTASAILVLHLDVSNRTLEAHVSTGSSGETMAFRPKSIGVNTNSFQSALPGSSANVVRTASLHVLLGEDAFTLEGLSDINGDEFLQFSIHPLTRLSFTLSESSLADIEDTALLLLSPQGDVIVAKRLFSSLLTR